MTDGTNLSLFHKILVFVEDRGEVTVDDLNHIGPQRQMLGALGRLEGLGYLQRKKKKSGDVITLTEKGDSVLADVLDFLPEEKSNWDGKWYMILFDIPEKERTTRQMFRLKLIDFGARMVQSSVWITPSQVAKEKFESVVEKTKFKDQVYYFEITNITPNTINVEKLWELKKVAKEYTSLFKHIDTATKQLKKDDLASYKAKCYIVALALIARKDPQLPKEFMPASWIGNNVPKLQTQLRSFCQS